MGSWQICEDVAVQEIRVSGASGELDARLYKSAGSRQPFDDLIVFFHGGGFSSGSIEHAHPFMLALACANPDALLLSSNYTLTDVSPFPAAIEDAYSVLAWAESNKKLLLWNGVRLIVSGIDAGANLATTANLLAYDRKGPAVAGQILITPLLDPTLSTISTEDGLPHPCTDKYKCYLTDILDRAHPYASPAHSSRLRHMSSALIFTGDSDSLRGEGERYAERLIAGHVTTVLSRLSAGNLEKFSERVELACRSEVLTEISLFLKGLAQAERYEVAR